MCYYSKTLRRDEFRTVKIGEDLTIKTDGHGHAYPVSDTDGRIVCVFDGSEVHSEKLVLNPEHERGFRASFPPLARYIGQPVSGRFQETTHNILTGPASDYIFIDGWAVALAYLGRGMKLYTGPKRPSLETKLGVDDPSIVHDHKIDETPTVAKTVGRALGLCSITR